MRQAWSWRSISARVVLVSAGIGRRLDAGAAWRARQRSAKRRGDARAECLRGGGEVAAGVGLAGGEDAELADRMSARPGARSSEMGSPGCQ